MKASASLQIRKEQLLVLGTTTIGRIQQCIGRGNALQLIILDNPIVDKEIDLVKHQISVCYLRVLFSLDLQPSAIYPILCDFDGT